MPLTDPKLWDLIRTWPLPSRAAPIPLFDPHRRRDFASLLYQSTEWTQESVERVIEIYRKFLYLKAISQGPVTPSKAIDTAWHLHLEFVEDYLALCRATGRDLRHDRKLTHVELDKAYLDGQARYVAEFDAPPDDDLWPSPTTIGNVSAKVRVTMVVGIALVVCSFAAATAGSTVFWITFGVAVCAGIGTMVWADRRWPGESSPKERSGCG